MQRSSPPSLFEVLAWICWGRTTPSTQFPPHRASSMKTVSPPWRSSNCIRSPHAWGDVKCCETRCVKNPAKSINFQLSSALPVTHNYFFTSKWLFNLFHLEVLTLNLLDKNHTPTGRSINKECDHGWRCGVEDENFPRKKLRFSLISSVSLNQWGVGANDAQPYKFHAGGLCSKTL